MNVLPIPPPPPLISFWCVGHVALLSTWPQGVAAYAPALPQWVFSEVSPSFATTNQSSLISTFSELASLSFLPSDVMHFSLCAVWLWLFQVDVRGRKHSSQSPSIPVVQGCSILVLWAPCPFRPCSAWLYGYLAHALSWMMSLYVPSSRCLVP